MRFVVAFPPGGNADLMGRLIGQSLSETFGRQFVIDNRGGAGGVIAEQLVARSAPDGYTILLVSLAHVVNPNLGRKLTYDPMTDLDPVSLAVSVPNVLVVHKSLAARSIPELIALAKSKPGELNYASSYATSLHLSGELFKAMAGVDIVYVNYKSGGLAVPDVEAGRVRMSFSVITTALNMAKSGRTRLLAVTSAERSAVLPEVPALAEFLPGYELTGWQAILAPAGTPRTIVSTLSGAIATMMRKPDLRQKLLGVGASPIGSTPEEFARYRKAEFAKVTQLASQAGLRTDK